MENGTGWPVSTISDELFNEKIPVEHQIALLGEWINNGTDKLSSEILSAALRTGGDLLRRVKERRLLAITHFFLANAYASLRVIGEQQSSSQQMCWEDKQLEQELINLRISFSYCQQMPISEHSTDLPFRVATNLGNALNHIGRFSEAIELWDYALSHHPDFAMAEGNRGYGLFYYSGILYDPGHQFVFLSEARTALQRSIQQNLEGGAKEAFERVLKDINTIFEKWSEVPLKEFSLGRSRLEKKYRAWSLANRLFVNPLNDIGSHSAAATDVLTLPPITAPLSEPPHLYGLFNQIKQEFVSARFLLFEGIAEEQNVSHFSDRGVLLYNTLDYPNYGLNIEKVKIAFLSAYSVLDKIAFLINEYYKLGIPERSISFRNIWYTRGVKTRALRPELTLSSNWPLRGLFWLSKDFYEDDSEFKESIEPDAKELRDIRNHMAHKYLKVHDDLLWLKDHAAVSFFADKLCFSIKRGDLNGKTIKLFKLVRNALIYCALAIHFEETSKANKREGEMVLPMSLDVFEDRWKM